MESVGIVAEYNPFHNGHLYHLNKVRELFPNDIIVLVLGGNFMQRGETSIINKWDKTRIALENGIDIVIELPFPFATQSADLFAKGAIQILKHMHVSNIVFGSEINDIAKLKELAELQLNNKDYDQLVKKYLDEGINYPTALSKAIYTLTNNTINKPNDLLGISYIREIIREKANINPISIKRTNDYHNHELDDQIASATSIRESLKNKKDLASFVPNTTLSYLNKHLFFIEDYFPLLKYQIMINIDNLSQFQTVDEGIENRIKKAIISSKSLEELINNVKTKRYTYNKIRRMFTHIMCNFTKEEASKSKDVRYLRLLGFNEKGRLYLNSIKKELSIPLITKWNKNIDDMLSLEFRATCVYASLLEEDEKEALITREYLGKPIQINNKNGY